MTEDLTLPSGSTLKITLAPFAQSKALYQAVLEELKALHLDPNAEVDVNLFKDIFCAGFASKKVEIALEECMKRVLYNGTKILPDTFEPVAAREDYLPVCLEVARANVAPFLKHLSSVLPGILGTLVSSQKSK